MWNKGDIRDTGGGEVVPGSQFANRHSLFAIRHLQGTGEITGKYFIERPRRGHILVASEGGQYYSPPQAKCRLDGECWHGEGEVGVGVSVGVGVKNISPIQSTGKPQKFFDILKENTTELVI